MPPGTTSLSVVVYPAQTVAGPDIGAGAGLIATVAVRTQPGIVYDIVTDPFIIPVTIPLTASIDPIEGLLLLHVPPGVASFKEVVKPVQALRIPVIGSIGFIVTKVVA